MTDLCQRLRAASLDDRLSTGALYREAAEMIEDANAAGIEQEQIIMNQERAIDRLRAAVAEWEKLRDPTTLHHNLLRGFPARLSRDALLHLAGDDVAARAALGEP